MQFSNLTLPRENLRNYAVGFLNSEEWPSKLNHLNSPVESNAGVLPTRPGAVVDRPN
jgi:hypothetical protein